MNEKYPMRMGKRGTVVIPARFRKLYGMAEGSMMIVETQADGVLLRPAEVVPVDARIRLAEFLLNSAFTAREYEVARKEVQELGLEPDSITHKPPTLRR